MAWHRFHEKKAEIDKYREWVQSKRKRSDKRIEMYIGKFLPTGGDVATLGRGSGYNGTDSHSCVGPSDQDRVTGYSIGQKCVSGQGSFTI